MQYGSRRIFNLAMAILSNDARMIIDGNVMDVDFIESEYGEDCDTHTIFIKGSNPMKYIIHDNDIVSFSHDDERCCFIVKVGKEGVELCIK